MAMFEVKHFKTSQIVSILKEKLLENSLFLNDFTSIYLCAARIVPSAVFEWLHVTMEEEEQQGCHCLHSTGCQVIHLKTWTFYYLCHPGFCKLWCWSNNHRIMDAFFSDPTLETQFQLRKTIRKIFWAFYNVQRKGGRGWSYTNPNLWGAFFCSCLDTYQSWIWTFSTERGGNEQIETFWGFCCCCLK